MYFFISLVRINFLICKLFHKSMNCNNVFNLLFQRFLLTTILFLFHFKQSAFVLIAIILIDKWFHEIDFRMLWWLSDFFLGFFCFHFFMLSFNYLVMDLNDFNNRLNYLSDFGNRLRMLVFNYSFILIILLFFA